MITNSIKPIHDNRLAGYELPFERITEVSDDTPFHLKMRFCLSNHHDSIDEFELFMNKMKRHAKELVNEAIVKKNQNALLEMHQALYLIYESNFSHPLSIPASHLNQPWLSEIQCEIEEAWLKSEMNDILSRIPKKTVYQNPDDFCSWFIELAKNESFKDKSITDYFKYTANIDEFKKFITIDANLNYRFFDALALTLIHYSEEVKLELCHHFWDECGEGVGEQFHTRQFTKSLEALQIELPLTPIWNDWRPYAGFNLYFLFGLQRKNYFFALGSLAMPELFDPERDRSIVSGFERLNLTETKYNFSYYYAHIEGDEEHGPAWLEKIIIPVVSDTPDAGNDLAAGALIRMKYMRLFNNYLKDEFRIS